MGVKLQLIKTFGYIHFKQKISFNFWNSTALFVGKK